MVYTMVYQLLLHCQFPTKANQPITQMQAKNLYDAFYNDGLFDNSKGTMTIMADPAPTKWALGNDGQYTQITNGTTVLATATDGSVRQIILGVSGFSAGLTTNGREVMTG
jgi:hypothetical protein